MAQQFDCPKTETELRNIQDKLYQCSKEAFDVGNRPAFKGLLEIMSAETTILTAIHNIKSNKGMLLTWQEQQVTVSESKKTYVVTAIDDVVRGGLSVEKRDSITGSTPQGDADFEGITFEVINNSKNPVIVNDKSIAPGEVALTLTTDSEGKCSSAPDALPFGEYVLHEKSTNESMLNTAPDQTVIIDEHSGLTPGKTYTLKGVLMDKSTGEKLMVNEKEITAEKDFTPESASGTEEITFTFDAAGLAGKAIVVFETLYHEDIEVTAHAEISDEGQTVEFEKPDEPEIKTTATVDGEKTAKPVGEVTITDTVSYFGLTPGKTYTLKGVLMDKATGEKLMVNDKEVTAEKEFTPESASGTEKLTFTFDASALGGKSVVVFETLYLEDVEVATHTDITDLGQTIEFTEPDKPEIKTKATVNGEKLVEPQDEITLIDTVSYFNLVPGKEYTVKGVLMDKATNKAFLVDGKEITAESTFTPDKPNGTVEIPFTFSAAGLAGKSVVVFESLYHEGIEVAVHADITDQDQTVEFGKPDEPQIKTTAAVNGEKKAQPIGEITIIDTVSYTGLTVGKTYKLSGVLMDKATGEPLLVDGQKITAEAEFVAEKSSGHIDIPFTFDASALKGKTVVVFETLYQGDKEVAVHTDIEDKDQTITFDVPEIKTKATVNGEKEVDPLEEITLIDTVTYSNLTPGKEYKVKGVLMDKSTGEKLLVDGKEVTAETTFTPDKSGGSVELSFTFNASGLAGKSIVAFETLYHKDVEVAVHADIEDEDQTVTIKDGPKLKTTATISGKKETTVSQEIVLEDKVSYTGLTPGKEYTVKGVLMDKSTGKKLLINGKEVTAEATFTPDKPDGEVTVTFKFDASGFKKETRLHRAVQGCGD